MSSLSARLRERFSLDELGAAGLFPVLLLFGLNADEVPTARGGVRWYPSTVRAALESRSSAHHVRHRIRGRDAEVVVGFRDGVPATVDGQDVSWRAAGSREACSGESTYTTRFTATKNGPLRLAVFDLDHRDNDGALTVTLRRLKG